MESKKGIHVTCLSCGNSVFLDEGLECKKCKQRITKAQQSFLNEFKNKK